MSTYMVVVPDIQSLYNVKICYVLIHFIVCVFLFCDSVNIIST